MNEHKRELSVTELAILTGHSDSVVRNWLKKGLKSHKNEKGQTRIFRSVYDKWDKPVRGRKVEHKYCKICGGKHIAKGLCAKCYARARRSK